MNKKYTTEITENLYKDLQSLKDFAMPDALFEAGIDVYKTSINTLNDRQRQLTEMVIDIQHELSQIKEMCSLTKKLIDGESIVQLKSSDVILLNSLRERQIKAEAKAKSKYPEYDEALAYKDLLCDLLDVVKFVYTNLSKARTDLRLKVQLLILESEHLGKPPKSSGQVIVGTPMSELKNTDWQSIENKKENN